MSRALMLGVGVLFGIVAGFTWSGAPKLRGNPTQMTVQAIEPHPVQLRVLEELLPPLPLQYVLSSQATKAWRHHNQFIETKRKGVATATRIRQSILYPPSGKLGDKNDGYIMVAVLSCCNTWSITKSLLESLLAMDDPIHVVLLDDASSDGTPEKAAEMGIPVLAVAKNSGATAGMNRAWQYFTHHPELQTLFILNNDILVASNTFNKLHTCAMLAPGPGTFAPMSNRVGLPDNLWYQDAENRRNRHFYGDNKIPQELIDGLPGTLEKYNRWLEEHIMWMSPRKRVTPVHDVLGFFMGFRKDQPIADNTDNILLRGSRNLHQEYWLFNSWRTDAFVCPDVFVYHDKGSTLKEVTKGNRAVKPEDMGFTR